MRNISIVSALICIKIFFCTDSDKKFKSVVSLVIDEGGHYFFKATFSFSDYKPPKTKMFGAKKGIFFPPFILIP